VTLDDNTITVPTCLVSTPTTTTTTIAGGGTTTTTTAGGATTTTIAVGGGATTTTVATGAGAGASGVTTTTTIQIPLGSPETGAGGSARSSSSLLWLAGLLTLGVAGFARIFIARARRS
jgi:hypothetical protein